jgi:hypothetical protein
MGRRSKLTPETQAAIVKWIRKGAFDYIAAEAAGIDESTFRRWMRAGENGNAKYRPFHTAVRQARADARREAEAEIFETDKRFWLRVGPGQARPGRPGWTESKQHEVTGKDGGPVTIQFINDVIERPE